MTDRLDDSTTLDEAAPDEPALDRTGTLAGEYVLESRIGDGGLADVYRARHPEREGTLAVKVAKSRANTVVKKRFQREARILMSLRHPNIVSGVDSGMVDGAPFIVMPFIDGETMRDIVVREGSLLPSRALRFATQIASALAAAHEASLIHRDLKPLNMIISRTPKGEVVRILDFGIARAYEGEEMRTRLTGDGLTGTPNYMAPEQVVTSVEQGPGVDLYALGAIICYMLTGKPPFSGSLIDVLRAHVKKPPPDLSGYGPLGEIATTLLQKRPEDRPASAAEVLQMLSAIDDTIALPLESLDGATVAASMDPTALVQDPTPVLTPSLTPSSTAPVVIAQVKEARPWPLSMLVLMFVVVTALVALVVSQFVGEPAAPTQIAPITPPKPRPQVAVRPGVVPVETPEIEERDVPDPPPPPRRTVRPTKRRTTTKRTTTAPPAPPTPKLSPEQRLRAVRRRLSKLVDHLSEADFGRLEDRYLALSEKVTKAPAAQDTLDALTTLERETKRLERSAP